MDLLYRRAGIRDLDMLTETRIQVLRAANHVYTPGLQEAGNRLSYAGFIGEGGQAGRYPIHYAGSHQHGQAAV